MDVIDSLEAQRAADAARERELSRLCGLLRICCNCKKIRKTIGDWEQLEVYTATHSERDFTAAFLQPSAVAPGLTIGDSSGGPSVRNRSRSLAAAAP